MDIGSETPRDPEILTGALQSGGVGGGGASGVRRVEVRAGMKGRDCLCVQYHALSEALISLPFRFLQHEQTRHQSAAARVIERGALQRERTPGPVRRTLCTRRGCHVTTERRKEKTQIHPSVTPAHLHI